LFHERAERTERRGLGTADQDAGGEDEDAAEADLERGGEGRSFHVAVANPGDDAEFDDDDGDGGGERGAEAGDEERERVADAAERGHEAADEAAHPGMAATGEAAIVGEGFSETHADAGADGRGEADQESVPRAVGGESGGEDGGKGRNRTVHQAGKAGLDDLQDEKAAVGGLFLRAGGRLELVLGELFGAVFVAALLLATIAKLPVDFVAAHLPAFDTDSNDLGLNAIFGAFALASAAWFGARRAVLTTYHVSRRNPEQVRAAWAVVGGIGLLAFVLFVYSGQQTLLAVAAELSIPTAFVIGAIKSDWKSHIHLPLWAILSIVVLSVVLPVMLLIPVSTNGGSSGGPLPEPLQTGPSAAEIAYDRVAPLWGSNSGEVLGADSGTIEQQSKFDMRYSQLNGPALNQFSNIRLEVWHGTSLPKDEAAYDPELVPDPSYGAPFLSRSLSPTADGHLQIHLDLSKVRANQWVIFVTATGPDGHRYRLNYPESFWSTFHGTAWDWLAASD